MALEVVTALESARASRRTFLTASLGLVTALLLPAGVVDAASRKRGTGERRTARHGRQRREAHTAGGRGQRSRRLLANKADSGVRDDALLARTLDPGVRSLSLYHLHTGERLAVDYFVNGRYEPECLGALNWALRDHRTDEVYTIDPGVLDLLYAVRTQLASHDELQIVCGYRSPLTNFLKWLSRSGVAEHSYHVSGQAIDFYVPHRSLGDVRRVARALGGGGVGYYPRSGFIHVDTGPVRYW
jgi:uncharacterized protein YcbK (DUF882 family)